jgi:hypothetical protein
MTVLVARLVLRAALRAAQDRAQPGIGLRDGGRAGDDGKCKAGGKLNRPGIVGG